jgi:calcineurin-like phosphoesterase family protein
MTIYFTGCSHFNHYNIIKLCNRPFNSVEEMDEVLIENWNKTVSKNDTVYHHGDFAYKGRQDNNEIIKRLNGKVILIQGNHDPVLWGQHIAELRIDKKAIVMCHYPIEEWNGYFRGAIHTHCHTHQKELASAPQRFNVGVDACGYAPISLDEILEHPNAKR